MLESNVIKGWITSLVGTACMIISLFLVFNKTIDFVWEGIGGLTIGTILLLAPKTIEKKVSEFINRNGGSDIPTPEPEPEPEQPKSE
jgi:hypothetical protein